MSRIQGEELGNSGSGGERLNEDSGKETCNHSYGSSKWNVKEQRKKKTITLPFLRNICDSN